MRAMNTELTLDPRFNPQSEAKQKYVKAPWNKDKLMGQKPLLKLKEVWGIRIRERIETANIRGSPSDLA